MRNPPMAAGPMVDTSGVHPYMAEMHDEQELANEGELIGYSEQILGKITDMAPGIPSQDDVLYNQPPETFVDAMHG